MPAWGEHVEAALRSAAITERDDRGLMPLADARKAVARKRKFARGKGRMLGGIHVWDADVLWAALCSLSDADELVKVASRLAFDHPPRGRDNVSLHERYGDAMLPLLDQLVAPDGAVPPNAWFVLPCLLAIGGEQAAAVALRVEQRGAPFFGSWADRHAEGWKWLALRAEAADARALTVLRALALDDPGATADTLDTAIGRERAEALRRAHDIPDGPTSEKVRAVLAEAPTADVPRGPTLGMARVKEHFREFAYPMWDNSNWFCGGMRVTGFADPEGGDALVFQALATGLGEGSLRREIWRIGGSRQHAMRPVDTLTILEERAIWGEGSTCLLTGVRRDPDRRTHVVPEGGARTSVEVPIVGGAVPIAVDTTGMKPEVAEVFANVGGPEVHLLVRLAQDHRAQVMLDDEPLARAAKLSASAVPLFRFDGFVMPLAGEPPTASDDLVAMVEALRLRKRLTRLPQGGHPLAGLYDRIVVMKLGGWGDAGFLGRPSPA